MAGGTVAVKFVGDIKDLERDVDSLEGKFSKFGKIAAEAFAVVGVAAAAMAVKIGHDAIGAASDLSESLSKVNVVFGKSADDINAWATSAAKSFGMSRQAALEATGTFGNFLISMGNPGDAAAEMSKSLVGLAADLASFNNANPEDVLLALRSGLSGEAEPLRKFGVALSAARIEAEGMTVGINESYNAMTAAEKSTLAFQVIMKDTALAQGDFARTSGGLANQQRILSAQFEDLKARLGEVLLPVMLKFTSFLVNNMIPAFDSVASTVSGWSSTIGGAGESVGGVVSTVRGVVEGALSAMSQFWDDHRVRIMAILAQVEEVVASAFGAIKAIFDTFVAVVTDLWDRFGNTLVEKLRIAFDAVLEILRGALEILGGLFDLIKAILTGKWGEAWDAILSILDGAWDTIVGVLKLGLDELSLVFELFKAGFSAAWSLLWNAVGTVFSDIWEGIKKAASAALDFVKRQVDEMLGPLDEIVGKLAKIGGGVVGGIVSRIPGFDTGGVVPGPRGSPQLILAHGGETVLPTHKQPAVASSGFPDMGYWEEAGRVQARAMARELAAIGRAV